MAATTRGVALLAGACSQGVLLLSANLESLNGKPRGEEVAIDVQLPQSHPEKIPRFCPKAGFQKTLCSKSDMSLQGAGVGWRSSRQLVPKQFCGSALACGC